MFLGAPSTAGREKGRAGPAGPPADDIRHMSPVSTQDKCRRHFQAEVPYVKQDWSLLQIFRRWEPWATFRGESWSGPPFGRPLFRVSVCSGAAILGAAFSDWCECSF